jgi:Uncharacterized conserved protein (DUF2285)
LAIAGGDWRDGDAYTRLLTGDRRCFAWEWLRRTPAYVDAWSAGDSAEPFGLWRIEDPTLDALEARPIWTEKFDNGVLQADGRLADAGDRVDFSQLASFATVAPAGKRRVHILLSDGLRSVRIDLRGAVPHSVPLALTWHVPGVCDVGMRLTALAQFAALVRLGRFARSLHPPQRRARRWIAMLRVHDAMAAGATNREIVSELYDVPTDAPRWRSAVGPWRLRVQRLASGARACLAMGLAGDDLTSAAVAAFSPSARLPSARLSRSRDAAFPRP